MQPNVITLPVDYLNNGTTTNENYERAEEYLNRAVYEGENHTLGARDQMVLYRSQPTRNGNFKGVGKSSVKFTLDTVVPGVDGADISAPIIVELSFSVPVGVSPADVLKVRQRVIAMADNDSVMEPLNSLLRI